MVKITNRGEYYNEISILWGMLVILVVLGHSFPDFENGMTHTWAILLSRFLYSFHMGLFFCISGFLFGKNYGMSINNNTYIKKRFLRLLVPYFVYSVITFLLKVAFETYANHGVNMRDLLFILIGQSPNGGLWFLWCLFVISTIIAIFSKIKVNVYILLGLSFMLNVFNVIIGIPFANNVLKYLYFYMAGIVIYKHYNQIINIKTHKTLICVILLSIVAASAILQTFGYVGEEFYLITASSGSAVAWQIASIIKNDKNPFLRLMSDYSYDIYLLSYFPQMFIRTLCDRIYHINYIVVVLLMFITGLLIPILLSYTVLRKSRFTRKIFLGLE